MKFIKRTLLFVALIFSGVCIAHAQTKSFTPEERAQKWDDWMKKELAITPDQEAGVHSINLKYAQMNEQLKDSEANRRSKFQEVKANENGKENELKQVLTKEQFKSYQEKKKDMQKQMIQSIRN